MHDKYIEFYDLILTNCEKPVIPLSNIIFLFHNIHKEMIQCFKDKINDRIWNCLTECETIQIRNFFVLDVCAR